ncbi:MAG: MarR family transcriptional regulator, partial [Desulfobacterales bacterium]|nr:MarR family transcriptional regulator [Desulfobacterales bacterium]
MTRDINRIRSFNRFYTQKLGLITNRFLKSDFSLVQARLLYELNHTAPLYATDLAKQLDLSPDYLSKALGKLERLGLMTRTPSPDDSRKRLIAPTRAGREAYGALRKTSNTHIAGMIEGLSEEERGKLLAAMDTILSLLEGQPSGLVTLRSHRPGDIGTVIHRHGVLYAQEYGFTHEFDAY